MKKYIAFLLAGLLSISIYSQTVIKEAKLGKELEKNADASAVFVSEMDLKKMKVTETGTVIIPSLSKAKIKVVSGMDMTFISERIADEKKSKFNVTFEVKDLSAKTYAMTRIEGIATVVQYREKHAEELKAEARKNMLKYPVQVVNQEVINLAGSEAAWLPGQIQDKLKSNLQEYLGMKTVVDSKSEAALKKLQAESESAARDESTAIELGKITTAKFALFTKLRKTASGYTISVDFTDLTTGEQMASATSKEYSKSEYLYGSTGAVDELTLSIGSKLGINISDLSKNLLTSGSASFSVDDQLALAKQNEAQFNKMMNDYDAELSKLMTSNDINAIQNKNRIEAEKALLLEKQNAERKRQEELRVQKARSEADAKLEAERSIALKTQRDKMAKDAAAKAAEVRKLKMERQGVLGQINVIESKKKALVEIRQGVEVRAQELYAQLVKDRESEETKIRNKSYSTVELGSDGNPTEQAKQRRENQVIKSYEDLTNKFFADCDAVKKATASQDASLLAEIRVDQKNLATIRTVSSMGDELKVSYGKYEGSKNGWNAYLSLYSDGILLYTDNFIVNYEALSGKKAPDMATELNDAVIEEYTNNVDMYNSLLTRGDPIIYFEIDYNVTAEGDDKPSQYKFNFSKIRVINTVSGKVTQTSNLNNVQPRTMKPGWDLREIVGIVNYENKLFLDFKNDIEIWNLTDVIKLQKKFADRFALNKLFEEAYENYRVEKTRLGVMTTLIKIPGKDFKMLKTEVTQELYEEVMGENPSYFQKGSEEYERLEKKSYEVTKGENVKKLPVERVSWYDAIYFCNKLSKKYGYTPVYAVDGETDVAKWNYVPHKGNRLDGEVTQNTSASGFRLPTEAEWKYAARGGQDYKYSGSNNLDEVGWYDDNSNNMTHEVAKKKPNGYGLYDMSGNVWEWCWDCESFGSNIRWYRGGGCGYVGSHCKVGSSSRDLMYNYYANDQNYLIGFRIVCNAE